jgi:hypothetical protein
LVLGRALVEVGAAHLGHDLHELLFDQRARRHIASDNREFNFQVIWIRPARIDTDFDLRLIVFVFGRLSPASPLLEICEALNCDDATAAAAAGLTRTV